MSWRRIRPWYSCSYRFRFHRSGLLLDPTLRHQKRISRLSLVFLVFRQGRRHGDNIDITSFIRRPVAMAEASSPPPSSSGPGIVGRVRGASISLINANPQLGMWQATGTAIAQAPNLTELRDAGSGGDNITFDAQGHSTRTAAPDEDGELTLVKTNTRRPTFTTPNFDKDATQEPIVIQEVDESAPEIATTSDNQDHVPWNLREKHQRLRQRRHSLYEHHKGDAKEKWGPTILNGLKAFWKFFTTPSGFLITIYGLNIVVCAPLAVSYKSLT